MWYEINVAKDGVHYFGTRHRSLTNFYDARRVCHDLRKRFPPEELFTVTMTRYEQVGRMVEEKDLT